MSDSEEKKCDLKTTLLKDFITCDRWTLSLAFLLIYTLFLKNCWALWQVIPILAMLALIHWNNLPRRIMRWALGIVFSVSYLLFLIHFADFVFYYIGINAVFFLFVFFLETQRSKFSLSLYSPKKKLFVLISIISIFIVIQALNIYGSRVLSQTYLQAEQAKCPLSINDLKEQTGLNKIDQEKNGGPLVIAAGKIIGKRLYKWRSKEKYLANFDWDRNKYKGFSAEQVKVLEKIVEKTNDMAMIIDKGLSFPQLRALYNFPKSESKIYEIQLSHLFSLIWTARILKIRSYYFTQKKNYAESVRLVSSIVRLAMILDKEPFLISYLVRITLLKQAWNAADYIIYHEPKLDLKSLQRLQSIIAPACYRRYYNTRQAFSSEIVFSRGAAEFSNEDISGALGSYKMGFLLSNMPRGWKKLDLANLLKKQLEYMRISQLDETKLLSVLQKKKRSYRTILYPLSSMLLPSLHSVMFKELISVANARCLWSALEIKIHQKKSSVFHENFNFVPQAQRHFISDPFTGKPLQYKKSRYGYVIYSFSEDGKDDNGVIFAQDIGLHIQK